MDIPQRIKLHKKSKQLELVFGHIEYMLDAEYLRVYSPSAEVKGHGPGQEVLQYGKMDVAIEKVEPVGNYALQIVFDDGHDSGLYSWNYLADLGHKKDANWQDYLRRLEAAGKSRDANVSVVNLIDPTPTL
ncbi:DUF971 domain-containing protein [Aurantivibrio plasticivorans]